MAEHKALNMLANMPTSRLEAIYNDCWRKWHNGIDSGKNAAIMALIEIETGSRGLAVSGHGGSFEFKQTTGSQSRVKDIQ